MEYRRLGKTEFMVSEIGLGCEHLEGKPYETVESVVHAALDGGVNVIDAFMSQPQIRTDIGNALKGRRDKVFIQGHIGSVWQNGQYGRSRDIALCREFFEDFLTRFHTDYIDLGMIHFCDNADDLDAIENGPLLDYMKTLKKEGKIRAIGMSSHDPVVARRAVEAGWLNLLMFAVNPAFDLLPQLGSIDELFGSDAWKTCLLNGVAPDRAALYQACLENDVGITVMKTLGGGLLFNPDLSPLGRALSEPQLIGYALSRPAVSSVLIGCQTAGEVEKALEYETMSAEERDFAPALAQCAAYVDNRRCVYCNHCLPCPAGIDVAAVSRFYDLAVASGEPKETVRDHYKLLAKHAGDCVGCGACESRCPFGVNVRERMAKVKELFGE